MELLLNWNVSGKKMEKENDMTILLLTKHNETNKPSQLSTVCNSKLVLSLRLVLCLLIIAFVLFLRLVLTANQHLSFCHTQRASILSEFMLLPKEANERISDYLVEFEKNYEGPSGRFNRKAYVRDRKRSSLKFNTSLKQALYTKEMLANL